MSFIVYGAPDGPGKTAEISVRARLIWHNLRRSVGLHLGLGIGVIAAFAVAVTLIQPPADAPLAAPEPLPKNPWADVHRPFQLYSLAAAEFGREPTAFEAKRHRDGGGRIDTLTWGRLSGEAPYLRLALHRVGREPVEDGSFFVHMVRQAAGFGAAVTRGGVADSLKTRFGAFETADMVLEADKVSANCLGFRFAATEPALRISGFTCGSAANPVDRRQLACALDRLDLVSAGEDRELSRFFAAAETRRDGRCTPSRNSQPNVQASWMDQSAPAPLRGVAARSRR